LKLILSFLIALFTLPTQAPQVAEKNAPAKAAVAPKDEPGERLVVTGRVFGQDGRTPLAGVSLYVYQTDKNGYYSQPTNDSRNPRLRGYLRTDAEGRYEFSTVKPGPYPNASIPSR
jgi:protocatechuate 3,4-dioxygenase, beta subunit